MRSRSFPKFSRHMESYITQTITTITISHNTALSTNNVYLRQVSLLLQAHDDPPVSRRGTMRVRPKAQIHCMARLS